MESVKRYLEKYIKELGEGSAGKNPIALHNYATSLSIHVHSFNFLSHTFIIKESHVHGLGVFTLYEVGHRIIVGQYTGKRIICDTNMPPASIEKSDYIMQTTTFANGMTHFIDSNDPGDCELNDPTRYVNGCKKKKDANVVAEMLNDNVLLITCAVIPEGGELLLFYGNNYILS
jgi:hypothetical protein